MVGEVMCWFGNGRVMVPGMVLGTFLNVPMPVIMVGSPVK